MNDGKLTILFCAQSISIHTGYGIIANDILRRLHATGKYNLISQSWYDPPAQSPKYPYESNMSGNFPFKVVTTGAAGTEATDMRHGQKNIKEPVSYTHLRAHETGRNL